MYKELTPKEQKFAELWKDIKGYKGLYQVSNLGNVKSLNFNRSGKEKIRKVQKHPNGYLMLGLGKDGKMKTKRVHQLVAIAFLNHEPNGFETVIDHIDNNPLNNRVDNLQLITNRANTSKDRKGTSKFTGVFWDKRRNNWQAKIYTEGRRRYLGSFKCETAASIAYNKALNELV